MKIEFDEKEIKDFKEEKEKIEPTILSEDNCMPDVSNNREFKHE